MAIMIKTTSVPHPTISATVPQSLRRLVLPLNCNEDSDFTHPERSNPEAVLKYLRSRPGNAKKWKKISFVQTQHTTG
jgi:hypothetical protein